MGKYIHRKPQNFVDKIEGEDWKDIDGFNGLYKVSSLGRVQSMRYGGKIIRSSVKKNGYYKVDLYEFGLKKTLHVHRLVAIAFIPNPESKVEINHKNGDKADNVVGNLEWSDRYANNKHAYQVLGRISTFTGKCGSKNPKSISVVATKIQTGEKIIFESMRLASIFIGVHSSTVFDTVIGRQRQTKGYRIERYL